MDFWTHSTLLISEMFIQSFYIVSIHQISGKALWGRHEKQYFNNIKSDCSEWQKFRGINSVNSFGFVIIYKRKFVILANEIITTWACNVYLSLQL